MKALRKMDARAQHHAELLKKVAQAWEASPNWPLGRLINYLQNFCETPEIYNIPDEEIAEACNCIVRERDTQAQRFFYTKPLLIAKFDPTKDTYLEIAKKVLVAEEYDLVLDAIVEPIVYEELELDLKIIVDSYFSFTGPK
jgi:hypothetical protein